MKIFINFLQIGSIHTDKLSNNEVNVDTCVEIGSEQVEKFHQTLPGQF